jgi:hypothetical protein
MTYHTTYPKLDTEDLYILSYGRSRFFTILFFMPKILGNNSGKNNKSCKIFYNESKKTGFSFSRFSTILYEVSKFQQKSFTI